MRAAGPQAGDVWIDDGYGDERRAEIIMLLYVVGVPNTGFSGVWHTLVTKSDGTTRMSFTTVDAVREWYVRNREPKTTGFRRLL